MVRGLKVGVTLGRWSLGEKGMGEEHCVGSVSPQVAGNGNKVGAMGRVMSIPTSKQVSNGTCWHLQARMGQWLLYAPGRIFQTRPPPPRASTVSLPGPHNAACLGGGMWVCGAFHPPAHRGCLLQTISPPGASTTPTSGGGGAPTQPTAPAHTTQQCGWGRGMPHRQAGGGRRLKPNGKGQ